MAPMSDECLRSEIGALSRSERVVNTLRYIRISLDDEGRSLLDKGHRGLSALERVQLGNRLMLLVQRLEDIR
jgi:hypothetical protein